MQRIKFDTDIRPLSDFRANVTSIIDEMKRSKRPIIITQHGRSAAVMMDIGEYEKLIEKLEVLSEINIAETDIEKGVVLSHQEVKKRIYKRIKK